MDDTRRFARVSALNAQADRPGRFEARIDELWTIAGRPNGGYLLALLGRAAVLLSAHPDVITASAQYLRAPRPGPAVTEARLLRGGRGASQVEATLWQDDQPCVAALIITAQLPDDSEPFWSDGVPDVVVAPFADCTRVPPFAPGGFEVPIMGQVEVRLDPATTGFAEGNPSGAGELRGWLRLPADEPLDTISLLYAVDAFPPATFEIRRSGWVPTLALTAYLHAKPAAGPARVVQRVGLIDAGRLSEECFVWDSRGRLVASATQFAAIRFD